MSDNISASIRDESLVDWVEEKVDDGTFRNKSHAVELGLDKLRDETEGDGRSVDF